MIPRRCSGRLYEILEVSKDATQAEVKRAYYRQALILHPDKTGGKTTEEFKRLQEAHQILSDPETRKKYDTFGRDGMRALESMGAGGVSITPGLVRAVSLAIFAVSVLALTFVSLIVVMIDNDMPLKNGWTWSGTVFVPVYIIDACVLIGNVGGLFAAARAKNVPAVFMHVVATLLAVSTITFARALDLKMDWANAFVPIFMWYGLDTLASLWSLRPSGVREALTRMGVANAEEMSVLSPLYIKLIAREVFHASTVGAFLVLTYMRAAVAEHARLSFWGIMAPLFVRVGLPVLNACFWACVAPPRGEDGELPGLCARLGSVVRLLLSVGGLFYTMCMIASKCEVGLNGATGYRPSAAVACVFLFITTGVSVLVSCCSCCFLPSVVEKHLDEEAARMAASAGDRGESGPAGGGGGSGEEKSEVPYKQEDLGGGYDKLSS